MRTPYSLRQRLYETYRQCVYCGSEKDLTIEHLVSKKSRRLLGLTKHELRLPENLVVACSSCNLEKKIVLL